MEGTPSLKNQQLMAVIWAGVGGSVLFTLFRYYVRLLYFRRLFLDDLFVFIALVILIASAVMYQFMAPTMYNIFRITNKQELPPADLQEKLIPYLKMQFAVTLLFWTCLWAIKFAFLAFFWRLGKNLRWQRLLWNVVFAFTAFAYIGCLISYSIACSSFKPGDCDTELHIQRALVSLRYSTAIDVMSDLLIIWLPVNLVWRVQMKRKEKAALGFLFSLGGVIVVFAIVRVVRTNSTTRHPEPIWLALWSASESSVAVIVSCMASFKTFFSKSTGSKDVNQSPGSDSMAGDRGGTPLVPQEVRVQTDVEVFHT
ncbi:MAG: hypothetical protein M1816_003136 [Peltula sp. TS41687]|nr:MAG: hypothetical protein M1816_003136 [Peltula sp. TS41687]